MSSKRYDDSDRRPLAVLGTAMGLTAALLFTAWSVLPLPDRVDFLAHVAFGPLVMAGFLGLEAALATELAWQRAVLAIARTWGIVAGASFTAMTLTQSSGVVLLNQRIAGASESAAGTWHAILAGVATVQLGLDVAWDVYVLIGSLLFAGVIALRPGRARVLGAIGLVIAGVTLVFNLATFPIPPREAGLVDGGPFVGSWFLIVSVWALGLLRRQPARHKL